MLDLSSSELRFQETSIVFPLLGLCGDVVCVSLCRISAPAFALMPSHEVALSKEMDNCLNSESLQAWLQEFEVCYLVLQHV